MALLTEECRHIHWDSFPELLEADPETRWRRIHCMLLIGQAVLGKNPHTAVLDTKVDMIRASIETKMDSLTHMLQPRLLNSSRKGKDYENRMEVVLGQLHEYTFERTTGVAHHGDGILVGRGGDFRIMVEMKDYQNTVPKSEIDKLKHDMDAQGISHALMVTALCRVSGHSDFDVEVFTNQEGRRKVIVYVARTQESPERMALIHSAISLHEKLSGFVVPTDPNEKARDKIALENMLERIQHLNGVLEEVDAFLEVHLQMETDIQNMVARVGTKLLQCRRKIHCILEGILTESSDVSQERQQQTKGKHPCGFETLIKESDDNDEYRLAVERLAQVLSPLGCSLMKEEDPKTSPSAGSAKTYIISGEENQNKRQRILVKSVGRKKNNQLVFVQDSPPLQLTLVNPSAFTTLSHFLKENP